MEQEERETIAEMQAVRTRGRQLKSQLAKVEYKLEMKDQLQLHTGNLHLVDYEQLKMENESLNEKASSQSFICILLGMIWVALALLQKQRTWTGLISAHQIETLRQFTPSYFVFGTVHGSFINFKLGIYFCANQIAWSVVGCGNDF